MGGPEHVFRYRTPEEERAYESRYFHLEDTHAKAVETLKRYQVNPELFRGRKYSDEEIDRDLERAKARREGFGDESTKYYADILEAAVCEHGELSEWFGPNVNMVKTSEYDDLENGVDMVAEFEDEESKYSHLALGIDVTFGRHSPQKKLERIKKSIDREKHPLAEVKYYYSERERLPRSLEAVPQVVIGVERKNIEKIGLLWMNRKNKELAAHPIQRVILEEAHKQLTVFREYALKKGKLELAKRYEKSLGIIDALLAEKRKIPLGDFAEDEVLKSIETNLTKTFSES